MYAHAYGHTQCVRVCHDMRWSGHVQCMCIMFVHANVIVRACVRVCVVFSMCVYMHVCTSVCMYYAYSSIRVYVVPLTFTCANPYCTVYFLGSYRVRMNVHTCAAL